MPARRRSGRPRSIELEPSRVGRGVGSPYAVIDIGSNSVRLVVYDELARAPLPRFNEKSLCRLGAAIDEQGMLSADGIRRTVEAMRRFRAIADAMGVGRIDAIATEAVRRAGNGEALVAAIKEEAGVAVRVLSGREEALYAGLGVISGFYRPSGLVGDMGGGSLEVGEIHDDEVGNRSVSLPLGALPVAAMLAEGAREAKRRIDALLKEQLPKGLTAPVFYAVGGGWRALARVHMSATEAPLWVAHGYAADATKLRAFAKRLWQMPPERLAALAGLPTRRAATLPAAALVLDRLLRRLGSTRVVFSALGLREGWLYAQLQPEERYLDPLIEGAQALGLPQARVADFAPALVRWTEDLVPEESTAQRRLRVAVCALSDLAWRDHGDLRAAESFRRLLQFPFIGLEHAERVFIAAAVHARYAGAANDRCLTPAIGLLEPEQRRQAQVLGRALLLAYRFSGGVSGILDHAHLRIGPESVRLEVGRTVRVPDSEVVGDRLRLLAAAVGVAGVEVVELDEPD